MRRLLNFLRGVLCLQAKGAFPERLLNLCAQEGIEFWAVVDLDAHTISFTTRRSAWNRVQELAVRVGCEVEQQKSQGLPDFLLRFQKRYGFLIGLTLSLCAVSILSQFVLTIQVSGNETVSTAVILNQLRQLGVKPGVYGPALDRQQIAQEALLELEDLAWMAINLSGTQLNVQVREKQKQPERIDESKFYHIVAETDGVVMHIEPELGDALVRDGDTVTKGEILISGTVTLEPPQYSDLPNRYYQKHARGRVWARTWRTIHAVIPMTVTGKDYTGEEDVGWSINFFGQRIEIFGNSSISWPFYDKITTVCQMKLPDGTALPVWLTRETNREYQLKQLEVEREAAQSLLEQRLEARLQDVVGADGEVYAVTYTARVHDGMLRVTAQAECYEEIGKEVPGTQESFNFGP